MTCRLLFATAAAIAVGLIAPLASQAQTTAAPDATGTPTPAPDGADAGTPTSAAAQAPAPTPAPGGPAAPGPAAPAAPATPALSAICTDRPTKSNAACTVDAGHVQYESDIINGTFLRLDHTTTDTWLVVNPTLKYGLTSNIDLEANIAPLEVVRVRDPDGDQHSIAGVSDLYLRLKYEFLNVGGGNLQASIIPYVKAPTARPGIGNGVVEGGAILPINYKLTSTLTLTTDPEVDFYKDSNGGGRHVNTAQLVNLGLSLPFNLTVYAELWGDWNFDPAGTIKQYSADTAIAYGVTQYLQLDAGLNFGLNRETPGVQAYFGVSQKF